MLWIKLTQRLINTPTPRTCSDPETKCDKKHKGGCGKTLTEKGRAYEPHIFKVEEEEKKGKIHWLCHKCAPLPCPFEGSRPRNYPEKLLLELQLRYYELVDQVLENTPLTAEQSSRLEGNRKVVDEIGRRLRLL